MGKVPAPTVFLIGFKGRGFPLVKESYRDHTRRKLTELGKFTSARAATLDEAWRKLEHGLKQAPEE